MMDSHPAAGFLIEEGIWLYKCTLSAPVSRLSWKIGKVTIKPRQAAKTRRRAFGLVLYWMGYKGVRRSKLYVPAMEPEEDLN